MVWRHKQRMAWAVSGATGLGLGLEVVLRRYVFLDYHVRFCRLMCFVICDVAVSFRVAFPPVAP